MTDTEQLSQLAVQYGADDDETAADSNAAPSDDTKQYIDLIHNLAQEYKPASILLQQSLDRIPLLWPAKQLHSVYESDCEPISDADDGVPEYVIQNVSDGSYRSPLGKRKRSLPAVAGAHSDVTVDSYHANYNQLHTLVERALHRKQLSSKRFSDEQYNTVIYNSCHILNTLLHTALHDASTSNAVVSATRFYELLKPLRRSLGSSVLQRTQQRTAVLLQQTQYLDAITLPHKLHDTNSIIGNDTAIDSSTPVITPYVCPQCSEQYTTHEQLVNHQLRHRTAALKPPLKQTYTCPVCRAVYTSDTAYSRHVNAYKLTDGTLEPHNKPKRIHGKRSQCTVCGEFFKSVYALNNHAVQAQHRQNELQCYDGARWSCPCCQQVFQYGAGLLQHVHHNHRRNKLYGKVVQLVQSTMNESGTDAVNGSETDITDTDMSNGNAVMQAAAMANTADASGQ